MDRNDVPWTGYWTAAITPFTSEGELDEKAFRAVLDRSVAQGVHGICVNGSTGEWFSQTLDERRRLAEIAVETVAGRVPTVIGVTCSRVDDAAGLAEHAARTGATSVMAAPPPLARPTPAELETYYREVFGAVEVPAWLYNFPQDNGHHISLPEIVRLAEIPNVVAIKQSVPSMAEFIETIDAVGSTLRVFGNMLNRVSVALIRGGFGGDGHFGSGMLLGADMPGFFEAVWRGDVARAYAIAHRYEKLMAGLAGDRRDGYNWAFGGMQATLKAAMNVLGENGGFPRRPKLPVDSPAALAGIRRILQDAGLDCTPPPVPHGAEGEGASR
ncbi:dihydrodipicolinate synthase family protein [Actinomadura madurae]|uniref:4-hydroxy-tetrahydrodipicolinate synthase n=1 Tax=Actinomadura madurae TaxID=1993 RepID=A0A1I5F6W7_9ACTN|nr:dihydrodipicolinate synthase family protein [Actinomadura madurae]SFO19386.1 4-hydroxy-tetrahydrodipicolinate synthase [Actinomadura madurae]SPT60242.1 Dihydrodipicolinate synthase [Actinomadura madurae]